MLKGCQRCHQVGQPPHAGDARHRPLRLDHRGLGRSGATGQRGSLMNSFMTRFGRRARSRDGCGLDRPDCRRRGAPPAPPRPTGVERNLVLTMWNWGDNVAFVHDEIATDKRNPRVNANGPDLRRRHRQRLPPGHRSGQHQSTMIKIPLRADRSTVPSMFTTEGFKPWRDFGERRSGTTRRTRTIR